MAVRMVFDRHGEKRRHTFIRGIMKSAARLSYQEAQAAIDGRPSDRAAAMLEPALKPLWAAYAVCVFRRCVCLAGGWGDGAVGGEFRWRF